MIKSSDRLIREEVIKSYYVTEDKSRKQGQLAYMTMEKHDKEGRLTERKQWSWQRLHPKKGSVRCKKPGMFRSVFAYENGKEVEQISYNAAGQVGYRIQSFYDSAGRLVKSVAYDIQSREPVNMGESVYSYDDKDRLIEERHILPDQEIHVIKYERDADGRIVRELFCNEKGRIGDIFNMTYDNDGNEIRSEQVIAGEIVDCHLFEYDSKGRMVRNKRYFQDHPGIGLRLYEMEVYEYRQIKNVTITAKNHYRYQCDCTGVKETACRQFEVRKTCYWS